MKTLKVKIGNIEMGGGSPIVVQTMCNTHTSDIDATVQQCCSLASAGAELIRITVPGLKDVEFIKMISGQLRSKGVDTPLVADIHFSSSTAKAVAPHVEKVRINPGNFHADHNKAKEEFANLIEICKQHNTAIRIGLNHGSLGRYITDLYGNTPNAMAMAAMEWLDMCVANDFYNVVVSLKSSNTVSMVEAYRILAQKMQEKSLVFPIHVGVTEAGNGDSGRIKSCVGISSLLAEGIGDTVRVSLTEAPENELPVAKYLSDRYGDRIFSSLRTLNLEGRKAIATYEAPSRERLILDVSCDFGKRLMDREIDELSLSGTFVDQDGIIQPIQESGLGDYLVNELMQASRRRFYKPEYIACPGCGRTMYNLQEAFEQVKAKTSHLQNVVIAVMGCIVNGPGEMADADWGYVGEGNGLVSIYKKNEPVMRHVPDTEAVDRLVELIEASQ